MNQFTSLRGTVQKQVEMSRPQIDFLKSLDTEEFYNKDEDEVCRYAHNTIQELIELGNQATGELIELLQTEFTWSCFFALTIFRETKDPQAIPALIAFLKRESDDSMANEEAMFALQDIGDLSIVPLIEDIEEAFDTKKYNSYLVGAINWDYRTRVLRVHGEDHQGFYWQTLAVQRMVPHRGFHL